MFNIIGNKWIFLTISGILVAASIVAIIIFGFKQGIDFAGGTQWQISQPKTSTSTIDYATLTKILPKEAVVTSVGDDEFLIRLPEISEAEHQKYLKELRDKNSLIEEKGFESIGPAVGLELRKKAIYAFFSVLLTISFYIAFAFRKVSYPVKSWKYGIVTLVTLFHDALIPAGLLSFLGWLNNIDVGTNFIVALLVVMGFSVHDTIVVFDRIRENIKIEKGHNLQFPDLVNKSVNETMARSINTSLTLVLVLLALLVLGPANLRYFILPILVGTVVGTYSSIFVASPLLVLWSKTKGR